MVEQRGFFAQYLHPFYVACAYLFLYLPIFVLILFSFNASQIPMVWQGFSLEWYKELLSSPELIQALKVSAIVAVSSTLLSLTLGTMLVMISFWWRPSFLFGIFYANLLLPDIILAIGIMSLFSFFNINLGFGSLITGHTLLGLGFVVPILRARFAEFDPIQMEASLDLGANYFQTCTNIILPQLKPGLIAAALLVFTLSLDDFMISFFCSGAQIQTLSVYIFYQIKTVIEPSINAISTCLLVVSSIAVMLLCYFKVIDKAVLHD